MGLMKRFSEVMKAKTSKMLDKAEDPRETLDYSYEKQLEMVQKVRRGLADVATSRKRLELPTTQLKASADKLDPPAPPAGSRGCRRRAGGPRPRGPQPQGRGAVAARISRSAASAAPGRGRQTDAGA